MVVATGSSGGNAETCIWHPACMLDAAGNLMAVHGSTSSQEQ